MERIAPRRAWAAALLGVLALAALPRAACLRTEPWLDEVWSIGLARSAATAADVFSIREDNSNPLNTLYLHFVSGSRDWAVYRLLSLSAGLLTIALLGRDPEDRARGLLAAALAAVSTQMTLYATEARGYAPAAFFAVAAYRLQRGPPTRARGAAFAACVLLGFMSHPTFAYIYAALFVRAAVKLPIERRVGGLLAEFGPATAAVALFELIARPTFVGGAEPNGFGRVILSTLALWSGASGGGFAAWTGAGALLALLGWELRSLRGERPDEFAFFCALSAGACVFVAIFPYRFERHFFVALPFALMVVARGLKHLYSEGGAKRALAVVLAVLFVIGNSVRVRALATQGRGHYLEAVLRMAEDTPNDVITVASDHDNRNRRMLEFYSAYLPPGKRLEYVSAPRRLASPPEWFLLHGFSTDPRRAPVAVSLSSAAYFPLVDVYPYGGLSGWTWMLYRRGPAPEGTRPFPNKGP
ncbi:MAG: hypothetical protein ACHQ2Z_02955 [Elusimicrobiota bacterium]